MRVLILCALCLLPVSAFAQYVDEYGNSLDHLRGYDIPRGGAGYRQPSGTIAYPPIMPPRQEFDLPTPTPRYQSQPDRYDFLQDKTPETSSRPDRSYRSDSILSDRVQPSRPGTRPY